MSEQRDRHLRRIAPGAALCALCHQPVRPDDAVVVTPDFLADDSDPLWRFADAVLHRSCFFLWDRRRAFIARYNRVARHLVAGDGSYPHMTGDGEIVRRFFGLTRRAAGRTPPGP